MVGLWRCVWGKCSKSCKSHCNGGVKMALAGTFAALC